MSCVRRLLLTSLFPALLLHGESGGAGTRVDTPEPRGPRGRAQPPPGRPGRGSLSRAPAALSLEGRAHRLYVQVPGHLCPLCRVSDYRRSWNRRLCDPLQSVRAQARLLLGSELWGHCAENCDHFREKAARGVCARPSEDECVEGLGRGLSQVDR